MTILQNAWQRFQLEFAGPVKLRVRTAARDVLGVAAQDGLSIEVREARKKLVDVGASFLPSGDIEVAGVRFHASYPTFACVLAEIFHHEQYNFSLGGTWVAFDIGANAGASSLWLASSENVRHVYAFEPVPPTYGMLLENLALNPDLHRKIRPFPLGLGSREETVTVSFHEEHVMSLSTKGTFDSCFNPTSQVPARIGRADDLLRPLFSRHAESRIFLKVDCEGAEYDILPNLASAGLLRCADVVIVEWHGGDHRQLLNILDQDSFFCFVEWHKRGQWDVGMIKAVNTRANGTSEYRSRG